MRSGNAAESGDKRCRCELSALLLNLSAPERHSGAREHRPSPPESNARDCALRRPAHSRFRVAPTARHHRSGLRFIAHRTSQLTNRIHWFRINTECCFPIIQRRTHGSVLVRHNHIRTKGERSCSTARLGRTGMTGQPLLPWRDDVSGRTRPNADHDRLHSHHPQSLGFGIDFIYTGRQVYRGESEEIVGKALKGRRDKTSRGHATGARADGRGSQQRRYSPSLDQCSGGGVAPAACRDRMNRVSIQIHRPSPETESRRPFRPSTTDAGRQGPGDRHPIFRTSDDISEVQWVAERSRARPRLLGPSSRPTSILNRSTDASAAGLPNPTE